MSTERLTPPKKEDLNLPACFGCENCSDQREGGVYAYYSNQHGGRYLCAKCFFRLEPMKDWPLPAKAKRKLKVFSDEIVERANRLGPERHLPNKKKGFKDHNVPFGKRPPKEQEDIRGLMAEIHFAGAMGIELTDEELTTYTGASPDYIPGVEVRARSFPAGWTDDRDFPVWDKDKKKNPHTYVAYSINRTTFEYEIRWLPFKKAWDKRRTVKMGKKGRDMPGVNFDTMERDLKALYKRVKRFV